METDNRSPENRRRAPRVPVTVVEPITERGNEPTVGITVSAVADMQDSLLVATNDLKRLEGLLDHATANLLDRFNSAIEALDQLKGDGPHAAEIRQTLHAAVTELQFHDMATQLLVHTGKLIQNCAYRLAEQTMEPDEEEAGLVVMHMPIKPNPVTQSEMDAGSIELF